jgi:hypothetical protein
MLSNELPKEYLPFAVLEICSNQFVNGMVPIEVHKNAILLIGRGQEPLIWLCGPVSKEGKQFQEIVEKNKSLNRSVDVIVSEMKTVVKSGEITILEVTKESEEKAIISKLDLRPVGLSIYGDTSGLTIGTNNFVGNSFQGTRTMIGIG